MSTSQKLICRWSTCQTQVATHENLIRHLRNQHGLDAQYGCKQCDYTHNDDKSVQAHITTVHGHGAVQEASVTLAAHYVRLRERELGLAARSFNTANVYAKAQPNDEDAAGGSQDIVSEQSQQSQQPHSIASSSSQLAGQVSQGLLEHKEGDELAHKGFIDLGGTNAGHRNTTPQCPYCKQNINADMWSHISSAHKVIIQQDPGTYRRQQRLRRTQDSALEPLNPVQSPFRLSEDAGINSVDMSLLAEDDQAEALELASAGSFSASRASSTVDPQLVAEEFENLRNCMRSNVLQSYCDHTDDLFETKDHEGRSLRVQRDMGEEVPLDDGRAVYAVQDGGLWCCQVTACGATLASRQIMDFHLWCHNDTYHSGYFCGEPSCNRQAGRYTPFTDEVQFQQHIDGNHGGSNYSKSLGRPISRQKVLNSKLAKDLVFVIRRDASDKTVTLPLDQLDAKDTEAGLMMPEDNQAQARTNDHWSTYVGTVSDPVFSTYLNRQFVFVSTRDADRPEVLPSLPMYVVETLYGTEYMREDFAKKYIAWFQYQCTIHATTDLDTLRSAIGPWTHEFPSVVDTSDASDSALTIIQSPEHDAPQSELESEVQSSELEELDQQTQRHYRSLSVATVHHTLPHPYGYANAFKDKSSGYLDDRRRSYRIAKNHKVLQRYGISLTRITTLGNTAVCRGFRYKNEDFECLDSISLSMGTAALILVSSQYEFTFSPRCDYCIHVLSQMSRPLAAIPNPEMFGYIRTGLKKVTRERTGAGSTVDDHESFKSLMSTSQPPLPVKAARVKHALVSNPEHVFFVDFETSLPFGGIPSVPLEVTVRNGKGRIIISCKINEQGVKNVDFETCLGFSSSTPSHIISHVRKFRGPRGNTTPVNARSAREIIDHLKAQGMSANAFWIEYSANSFDRRAMEMLAKQAGIDPASFLPVADNSWDIIYDFRRWLPGLARYRLGDLGRLMIPNNISLQSLHTSIADTDVLYNMVDQWFFRYST
ncbi:putative nucleic acid binding protein 28 [Elsinoe australis]|uniref:Putative nucleic acid binding protein 28 n=1 Tax=Elsinoe australis TaxID=40998 RepID=A0A4U7AT66_9PEZI|nr:putative nucleic acid binding protein 28 [Elsinoe australis]